MFFSYISKKTENYREIQEQKQSGLVKAVEGEGFSYKTFKRKASICIHTPQPATFSSILELLYKSKDSFSPILFFFLFYPKLRQAECLASLNSSFQSLPTFLNRIFICNLHILYIFYSKPSYCSTGMLRVIFYRILSRIVVYLPLSAILSPLTSLCWYQGKHSQEGCHHIFYIFIHLHIRDV